MTSPTSSTAGNTLAIDTSGVRGSLALAKGPERFQIEWDKKAVHSELATVKLQELLEVAKLPLTGLDRIIVNCGPGSFTGIRVGLNLARALSYSLAIPIASLNTLELLAFLHREAGQSLFVAIKAIQNFYYVAGFDITSGGLAQRLAPRSVAEPELPEKTANYLKFRIEGQSPGFTSELSASIGLDLLDVWPEALTFSNWKEVRPVYIRASEAEEKLLKGLLKA